MNIYERFATIKAQIKELEQEQRAVEVLIVEEIKGLSAPMKTEYGTFTKVVKSSYKYSSAVTDLVDEIKKKIAPLQDKINKAQEKIMLAQKKEQENGIAEKEDKIFLRFIETK